MPGLYVIFEDGEKVEVPHEIDVEGGAAVEHWYAAELARREAAAKHAAKIAKRAEPKE